MPPRVDALLLRGVAWELDRALQGASLRKISQVHESDFLLTLFGRGETFKVLVSLQDDSPRVHQVERPPPGTTAQVPGAFCMLLRKHLEGARISRIDTWGLERVLCFHLRRGETEGLLLAIEMTVVSRTMMLAEGNRILGTWHRLDERSVLPQVLTGPGPDMSGLPGTDLVARLGSGPLAPALIRSVFGLNRTAAAEISFLASECGSVAQAWDDFRAHLLQQRFVPTWCEAARAAAPWPYHMWSEISTIQYESFSAMLEQQGGTRWVQRGLDVQRQGLVEQIGQHRARLQRRMAAQRENLAALHDVEQWQRKGELLLTVTGADTRSASVVVMDYYADPPQPLTLPVDPRLTVSENAARAFNRYKKGLRGRTALAEQLARGGLEARYLDELELAARTATTVDEVREAAAGLTWSRPAPKPSRRVRKSVATPIRRYRIEGFDVLVGRNPRQNEEISLRLAAPDDLWLHARQVPGAHVLIRQTGPGVPDTVLLTAATLAGINSQACAAGKVEVDYTRARYIRKPPQSPPGTVTYRQEKTIIVRTDAEAQAALPGLVQC